MSPVSHFLAHANPQPRHQQLAMAVAPGISRLSDARSGGASHPKRARRPQSSSSLPNACPSAVSYAHYACPTHIASLSSYCLHFQSFDLRTQLPRHRNHLLGVSHRHCAHPTYLAARSTKSLQLQLVDTGTQLIPTARAILTTCWVGPIPTAHVRLTHHSPK